MRLIIRLGTALAILTSVAAEAADSQNRFQPYGLGRAPCKRFTEICEAKQEDCKQTGPWIDGYVTAYNSLDKGTFDMFAWQTPELFAQMVFNVCKQHPEAAVVQVVNELMRVAIAPDKVSTAGERVKIGDGTDAVFLYREGIKDVQQRLIDLGFLKGKADGAFGPGTQSALQDFQKKLGLDPSGLPNDMTLMGLFYAVPQQQQRPAAAAGGGAAPAAPASSGAAPQAPAGSQPPAKLDLNLIPKTN